MRRTLIAMAVVAIASEANACAEYSAPWVCDSIRGQSAAERNAENQRIIADTFREGRLEDAIRDSARRNAYTPPPVDTTPPSWSGRYEWETRNGVYQKYKKDED